MVLKIMNDLDAMIQIAFENARNNAIVTGEKSIWMVEYLNGQQMFVSVETEK